MNLNRILILAGFDLRHALLRLKGLIFLIPFLFFWIWVLKFLYEKGGDVLVSKQSLLLLSWLYKPAVAQILLISHPASLSVYLILALATIPFFAMLGSSDQLAGDAARQSFRFFLTRCTRTEIFLGRLISSYSLIAAATLLTLLAATYISWHNDHRPLEVTLLYAAQVGLLTLVYILPFVAFMSAVSALMSAAMSSLLMGMVVYFSLAMTGSYLHYRYSWNIILVPGQLKELLFGIQPHDQMYASAGLLAYAIICGALGWFIFHRRNL